MINTNRPIGIFDSGIGGLTAVRQLIKFLPNEDIIYLGDTARVPYGNKSESTVKRFSIENALYLLKHNVKLIIVACNTSSSLAINELKKKFKIPIVGVIDPGVKNALAQTNNKRIGIIGTNATIDSGAYQRRILQADPSIKVFAVSCPLFVPLVEEGWLDKNITIDIIRKYLISLKKKNIDTLILGCTHYPLLKSSISKVMGPGVYLVDSATQVALSVKYLMRERGISANRKKNGKTEFYLTDTPYMFEKTASKFLGQRLTHVKVVKGIIRPSLRTLEGVKQSQGK